MYVCTCVYVYIYIWSFLKWLTVCGLPSPGMTIPNGRGKNSKDLQSMRLYISTDFQSMLKSP